MAKRFIFDSPDQLQMLEASSLLKEGRVLNTARVWRVSQRQGKDSWDGMIGVCFLTEGRDRVAKVYRKKPNGEEVTIARLKYNPALEWCRKNLRQAD